MKSKPIAIFSFLLFCIFLALCHGESRAEAGISELSFNLIRQNLRPFENVSLEFLTELENQKTQKWEQEGRHRLVVDFSKGFYKLSSVRKTPRSKHCRFVEKGWDGKYVTRVEKSMTFTPDLKFVGMRDEKNVSASVASGEHQQLLTDLCPFLFAYEGERFDKSLYSLMSAQNVGDLVFSQKSRNEITMTLGWGYIWTFNKENGAMLSRVHKGRLAKGGEVFDELNFKVEKTENKDGWFFPSKVVSTYRNSMGEISLRRRTTLLSNSLSINDKLASGIFTPKIPIRANLTNHIESTQRVVTELDPFLDREGFQKQMDTFVDELRKDLKR